MTTQHTDCHQGHQYGQGYWRKNTTLLRNGHANGSTLPPTMHISLTTLHYRYRDSRTRHYLEASGSSQTNSEVATAGRHTPYTSAWDRESSRPAPLWTATTDSWTSATQVPSHTVYWQLDTASLTGRWRSHWLDITWKVKQVLGMAIFQFLAEKVKGQRQSQDCTVQCIARQTATQCQHRANIFSSYPFVVLHY